MKKKLPQKFNKLASFLSKKKNDIEDSAVAERQSPQSPTLPPTKPAQEAEAVVNARKIVQRRQGKPVYER
jgi:hypothetical protein